MYVCIIRCTLLVGAGCGIQTMFGTKQSKVPTALNQQKPELLIAGRMDVYTKL